MFPGFTQAAVLWLVLTVPAIPLWVEDDAATQRICASVAKVEIPKQDFPSVAARAELKGCDSEVLYYGIGTPADPVKARQCAMTEIGSDEEPWPLLSGEGILMMIYANGRGVPRNLDVAIHLACQLDDSIAAREFRVARLDGLRRSGRRENFQTCDDITSGAAQGICTDHEASLAAQARLQRIARLKRRWNAGQSAAFDRVYASVADYADKAHEMDCFRGTAMGACNIIGREHDVDRFLGRIEALANGKPMPKDKETGWERPNPATQDREWRKMLADLEPDERPYYETNRDEVIAARRIFERDLIAFLIATMPGLTPHRIRTLFSDI
ncbi:hypothetical protein P1X14_12000 [Sphingomonas sp. AOB5]|uniref:hypothetical protein n=1 Tax=Sphingomonas sp. AOB5 TaxID=3034017 RepID=UPI0023F65246|nr:hypothetical protein [Sphingomonas sp. AOB5]MDF7775971.1 hypothetical protein [Sphingomonas sp. AOB5]